MTKIQRVSQGRHTLNIKTRRFYHALSRDTLSRSLLILSLGLQPAFAKVAPGETVTASDNAYVASLPELGQPADLIADSATEYRLGQAFLRQLRASTPLYGDVLVREYLENLVYRLSTQSPLIDPVFTLIVVDDRQVNAFAVPGGVIGVNTGLILTAESEDELAGVLAHELGHLSQRHFARSQEANKYNQWLALGGLLASIAAASAGGSQAGLALGASAQSLAAQNQLRYSRNFEQEADRIGLQTLTQSGYEPRAMPTFFARLDRSTRQLGYVPEFLLTHPLSSTRLSDLERRVSQAKRTIKPADPSYRLLQVRLQMAYSDQLDENIRAFETALQDGEAPVATRYGLSLAYLRQSRMDEALSTLAPLLKADPNRLEYRSTEIDIAMARRDYAQALALSQSIWSIYPDQRSILEPYTRAALALNQASRVRPLLDKAVRDHANDTAVWRLLADCAAQQKDAMAVFRARAEILYLNDREKLAEEQLKNALRLAANNYSLTAQLNQRLTDMRRLDAEFKR
ncbi:MAG: M48 family metalloprotease [Pseudomonadota bacterium]